jgi:hypothetical protein
MMEMSQSVDSKTSCAKDVSRKMGLAVAGLGTHLADHATRAAVGAAAGATEAMEVSARLVVERSKSSIGDAIGKVRDTCGQVLQRVTFADASVVGSRHPPSQERPPDSPETSTHTVLSAACKGLAPPQSPPLQRKWEL